MEEMFGEQQMLILHRVALEIEYADRLLRPQTSTGVDQTMEIIQLDDDEMVDGSQMRVTATQTLVPAGGMSYRLSNYFHR